MACLGLWDMFGLRMDAQRVALDDFSDRDDDAVGPFHAACRVRFPMEIQPCRKTRNDAILWKVIYVFTLQNTVIRFSSPSTMFCPAVYLAQPIQGMAWTHSGRFSDPVSSLSGSQRQALADWFSHPKLGMLNARRSQQPNYGWTDGRGVRWLHQPVDWWSTRDTNLSDTGRIPNLPANPVALSLLGRPAKGGASAQAKPRWSWENGVASRCPIRHQHLSCWWMPRCQASSG